MLLSLLDIVGIGRQHKNRLLCLHNHLSTVRQHSLTVQYIIEYSITFCLANLSISKCKCYCRPTFCPSHNYVSGMLLITVLPVSISYQSYFNFIQNICGKCLWNYQIFLLFSNVRIVL